MLWIEILSFMLGAAIFISVGVLLMVMRATYNVMFKGY